MAQQKPDRRGERLNTVLTELDAAIAARFDKPQSARSVRQDDHARDRTGLRAIVAAALRWFSRSPIRRR